jgi:hypothetical protein
MNDAAVPATVDMALIGAGIMSASVGALLKAMDPSFCVAVLSHWDSRQPVADQMHDAGLRRRLRGHRLDRLGESLRAVYQRDQDVLHPAGLRLIQPEPRTLGLLDPKHQHLYFRRTIAGSTLTLRGS